jgi:hypothetical protein
MKESDYARVAAQAFRRIDAASPRRAAWELAADDQIAKGERLAALVGAAIENGAEKRALTRALTTAFELAAVVSYYAHEGGGGVQTVQNEIEAEIDAVDADAVEQALVADLEEMHRLLARGGWQTDGRFPRLRVAP